MVKIIRKYFSKTAVLRFVENRRHTLWNFVVPVTAETRIRCKTGVTCLSFVARNINPQPVGPVSVIMKITLYITCAYTRWLNFAICHKFALITVDCMVDKLVIATTFRANMSNKFLCIIWIFFRIWILKKCTVRGDGHFLRIKELMFRKSSLG